jgi:hypothetical protein
MSVKPCINCTRKKRGCLCREFEIWALDESLPEPILNMPKPRYKFNPAIIATPDCLEIQKGCGTKIKGFKSKLKEK